MKFWVIADTHFFHGNVIKYCNRPFKDYKEMNEQLIIKWNSVVAPEDIVFHLGDFSFGHKEKIESIKKQLNGTVILIKGNHDRDIIRECGFIVVEGALRVGNLILTHRPLEKEEIPQGFINVHGHIHNLDSYYGINVSVEKTNYEPVELKTLN